MNEVNEAIDRASARRRKLMKWCQERFEAMATEELKGMSEESQSYVVCLMTAALETGFRFNQIEQRKNN